MIAIIDYGVGNLFSLRSSLEAIGAPVCVTGDESVLARADRIVLPGVGAFGDAARKLRESGLDKAILRETKRGKPLLGICLGMQLLFDESLEYGLHEGLHLIPGRIVPMKGVIDESLKIPHIGWNALSFSQPRHPLFRTLNEGDFVYFVHSYYARTDDGFVIARTGYGAPITAAAARGRVMGCQFHPEKSGAAGLKILRAFCETEDFE